MQVEIADDLLKILFMDNDVDLTDDAAVANKIDNILMEELQSASEWGSLSDKADSAFEYYQHRWNLNGWKWEEKDEQRTSNK